MLLKKQFVLGKKLTGHSIMKSDLKKHYYHTDIMFETLHVPRLAITFLIAIVRVNLVLS